MLAVFTLESVVEPAPNATLLDSDAVAVAPKATALFAAALAM